VGLGDTVATIARFAAPEAVIELRWQGDEMGSDAVFDLFAGLP
jgi:hypothetical protein